VNSSRGEKSAGSILGPSSSCHGSKAQSRTGGDWRERVGDSNAAVDGADGAESESCLRRWRGRTGS
jgi:hypothetical protein